MLKGKQNEIVLAIFLASLLLFSYLLRSKHQGEATDQKTTHGDDTAVQAKTNESGNSSYDEYRQFYETIKDSVIRLLFYRVGHDVFTDLATIILAIATSALAMIALWQWTALNSSDVAIHESAKAATDAAKAAKDSVRLTRNAMKLDQRAWIGVSLVDPIPSIPVAGKTFAAKITITNSGRTPARNIVSVGTLDPLTPPELPDFTYTGREKLNMGTIAPGGGGTIPFTPLHDNTTKADYILAPEFINKLIDRTATVYVSGRIDYSDIFGVPHWTTYCAFLIVPFNGQFGRCESHNDTDDYNEEKTP